MRGFFITYVHVQYRTIAHSVRITIQESVQFAYSRYERYERLIRTEFSPLCRLDCTIYRWHLDNLRSTSIKLDQRQSKNMRWWEVLAKARTTGELLRCRTRTSDSVEKKQRDTTDGQMSMDFAWTPLHETKGFAERIRRDEYGVDFWWASKGVLGSTCLWSWLGPTVSVLSLQRTEYSYNTIWWIW